MTRPWYEEIIRHEDARIFEALAASIPEQPEKEVPLTCETEKDALTGQDVTKLAKSTMEHLKSIASSLRDRFQAPLVLDRKGQSVTRGFIVRFYHEIVPEFIVEGVGTVYSLNNNCLSICTVAGSVSHAGRRAALSDTMYQFPAYRAIPNGKLYAFNPGQTKKEWIEVLEPCMTDVPPFDLTKVKS